MTAKLEPAQAMAEDSATAAVAALRKVRSLVHSAPPSRAFAAIATLRELAGGIETRFSAGEEAAAQVRALISAAQAPDGDALAALHSVAG